MNTTASIDSLALAGEKGSMEALLRLATVRNRNGQAISYYCTSEPYSARSHWAASAKLENLIDHATLNDSSSPKHLIVSESLARIIHQDENARQLLPRFQAVFECNDSHIFEDFAVPAPGSICSLEADTYFHLVPLWQALQASKPYGVALVGHGRARCFTVRGPHIAESAFSLSEDLSPREEGEWSHHIEGNQREREKHFIKHVAADLSEIVRKQGYRNLVVSCRDELLGDLLSSLSGAGLSQCIAGSFQLPNLDIAPEQVLENAERTMATYRESLLFSFWEAIREHPDRSAMGIKAVMDALQAGRVQKLLLAGNIGMMIGECSDCGGCLLGEGDTCPSCGSSIVYKMAADELLLRKSFLTDVEILTTSGLATDQTKSVAAILRY